MNDSEGDATTRTNFVYPQFKPPFQHDANRAANAEHQLPFFGNTAIATSSQQSVVAVPLVATAVQFQSNRPSDDDDSRPEDRSVVISNEQGGPKPPKARRNNDNDNGVWKWRFLLSVMMSSLAVVTTGTVAYFVSKSYYERQSLSSPAQDENAASRSPTVVFQTTKELYGIVDLYLAGDRSATLRYGPHINAWDVSNIRVFDLVFSADRNPAAEYFDADLNEWNTSSAESMMSMFSGATMFNGNVSSWQMSQVTDTSFMFNYSHAFDGDVSNWNVSNVVTMEHMFHRAYAFQGDLSRWQVKNVRDMDGMFDSASSFNSDISGWDVSQVENIGHMFGAADLFNQDLSRWNLTNVVYAGYMFNGAATFNQNLCQWTATVPAGLAFEEVFSYSGCPNNTHSAPVIGPMCHNCASE